MVDWEDVPYLGHGKGGSSNMRLSTSSPFVLTSSSLNLPSIREKSEFFNFSYFVLFLNLPL